MTINRVQTGFTLVEVLVAFSIATVSLSLLFQIHSNAARTISLAEDYSYAADLAASLIAEHSVTERELAFALSGLADDRYRWTIEGRRFDDASSRQIVDPNVPKDMDMELRRIDVTVAWSSRDRERQFHLSTLRPFFREELE